MSLLFLMPATRKCLNKLVSASSSLSTSLPSSSPTICPSCRAPFSIQNADTLPVDFTKNSLCEVLAEAGDVGRERGSRRRPSVAATSPTQSGSADSALHQDAAVPPKHRRSSVQHHRETPGAAHVDESPPVPPTPPVEVHALLPPTHPRTQTANRPMIYSAKSSAPSSLFFPSF